MIERSQHIVLCLSLVLIALGCKKVDLTAERSIDLDDFHHVNLDGAYDIYFQEDTAFYIEMTGDAAKIEGVVANVSNDTLLLTRETKRDWLTPRRNNVSIIIHSEPLSSITANETCNMKTVNPITSDEIEFVFKSKAQFADLELDCNIFFYWNQPPVGGTLDLRGSANQLKIWNTAITSIDAQNLQVSDYCIVENDSKGDCIVNISGKLEYKITDEGNIQAYGSPNIIQELGDTGEGELILH